MLALWWLGSVVEQALGTWRFLLVYFVSGLAGSAGALLLSNPGQLTVGASGAIYGILGALLILEWLQTGSLAGPAMTLIVLNLAFSFAIPGISIGGHLGGLVGGIARHVGARADALRAEPGDRARTRRPDRVRERGRRLRARRELRALGWLNARSAS